ncbi:MAG: methionine--tRNA ligase [Firmicutes bacterium]|nr:methionine--tRNA ligase [Bacillota bacterium]
MGTPVWYITTPIYYPSDKLHIGHAYTTVAADALARYHRLNGESVFFVTGTDEHGQKIEKSAKEKGMTPQAFVDDIVAGIRVLWNKLGVSFDDFIRTTERRHEQVVQAVFRQLKEQGDIYKGEYEGWYCLPDETFWTDSKLVDGRCPVCGRPVEKVRQESYFFRLSRYQDRMLAYLQDHPDFVQPASRRHEMISFIQSGLEDLSISRTGMSWGIPVPDDGEHVIYVWFDALLNYLTAAGYGEDPQRFAKTWPANVHLVGKEIVRFHAVIWPIMLMALGLPLPEKVFGHGWLLIGETKMSKSLGNAVDPFELIDRYGIDAVRYYLLREVPFGADGSYTEEALILRTNVDLANDLGNLLSRTTAMIERFRQGEIPMLDATVDDKRLAEVAAQILPAYRQAMENLQISDALTEVYRLVHAANKYIEDMQPWALAKDAAQAGALDSVLYHLAESLRVISVLLSPFLLETPGKIREQLGIDAPVNHLEEAVYGGLEPGGKIRRAAALFPRIDRRSVDAVDAKTEGETVVPEEEMISIEEFQKVHLRVGTIRQAEVVKGADRLLKLTVYDGERERVIVSGIRAHYDPLELIGQQVVLVANLKPVKLRGILSEGMLLAGSDAEHLALVQPQKVLTDGAKVK